MENKKFDKLGVIGRFRPVHSGAYEMLKSICENANTVMIGIGSANKYNVRSPFTANEAQDMINLCLKNEFDNYQVIQIPDSAHIPEFKDGKKWKEYVFEKFGELDCFVSSNDYVRGLLRDKYKLLYPTDLIKKENQFPLKASEVRYKIAAHLQWENLVPSPVKDYLNNNSLIDRFRKEFGLETLALLSTQYKLTQSEDEMEEKLHTFEV